MRGGDDRGGLWDFDCLCVVSTAVCKAPDLQTKLSTEEPLSGRHDRGQACPTRRAEGTSVKPERQHSTRKAFDNR